MEALWNNFCAITFQFIKLFAFTLAVVLPATWVSFRRLNHLSVVTRLAIGVANGFAIFVVAGWYLGIWSLNYLLAFWIAQFPVAGWLSRSRRPLDSERQVNQPTQVGGSLDARVEPSVQCTGHGASRSWLLIATIAAAIALQLYALHFSILPQGVDSSFHCVVAQRQVDAGRVTTDLWPLERLRLNYPLGSHIWLAVASQWTGLAVHEVFRHSFALAICGAALMIAAWAERLFGTALHGVAASFAFLFLFPQASLFPYTWGGLPSLIAIWLGMTGLFCVIHLEGVPGLSLGALLLASAAMTHHHTMVALLGGTAIVAGIGCMVSRGPRSVWIRILAALAAAAFVAGIYLVPLLLRVGDINQTTVLTYVEPFNWPWKQLWIWSDNRLIFAFTLVSATISSVAVVMGLRCAVKSKLAGSRSMLLGLVCIWLLTFCTLDYGIRLVAHALDRPSIQPFTPSRFVYDAQFILGIIAAGGLVWIWERARRPVFRFALAAVLACGAVLQVEPRWRARPDDAFVPMGQWADKNLPRDSLVTGAASVWATYVFHRESVYMFIPISEQADQKRMQLKQTLLANPASRRWSEWKELLGKSVYVVGYSYDSNAARPPIVKSGALALYDVNGID